MGEGDFSEYMQDVLSNEEIEEIFNSQVEAIQKWLQKNRVNFIPAHISITLLDGGTGETQTIDSLFEGMPEERNEMEAITYRAGKNAYYKCGGDSIIWTTITWCGISRMQASQLPGIRANSEYVHVHTLSGDFKRSKNALMPIRRDANGNIILKGKVKIFDGPFAVGNVALLSFVEGYMLKEKGSITAHIRS